MAWCNFDFEPQFVDKSLEEEYQCPICLQVMKNPELTSCCGHHFCHKCINEIKKSNQCCPRCKKQGFRTLKNRQLRNKINELKVYCYLKEYGCNWTGSLEQLEFHLDLKNPEGECQYAPIQCPHCQKYIQRDQFLTEHTPNCPQRPFTCEYCGFQDTYHQVTAVHWLTCLEQQMECPNQCGVPPMRRRSIHHHLNSVCLCEAVECEYSFAGCRDKVKREEMAAHMKDSVHTHLDLVTQHCGTLESHYTKLQNSYSELENSYTALQSSYSELECEVHFLRAQVQNSSCGNKDLQKSTLWWSTHAYT